LAIIIDGCFQYLIILRIRHVARFQLADFTVEAAEAVAAGSLTSSACWRNNQQLYYECTNTVRTVKDKTVVTPLMVPIVLYRLKMHIIQVYLT